MRPKVSVVKCPDYNENNVTNALQKALTLIGGLEQVVKKGDKVLLKVNLLQAKAPEASITTHPQVVKSLVRILQDLGAVPLIGDSPGGAFLNIDKTWQVTGMSQVAEETGAKLVSFEKDSPVKIDNLNGIFFKNFYIARPILEVDKIISVPKLKTHGQTLLTGALKNFLGVIPGLQKVEFHRRCPKPFQLAEALVELFSVVRPQLAVMDSIMALEGNGPGTGGVPRLVGCILVSKDIVAIDAVASSIVKVEPENVLTTKIATERNLGQGRLEYIDIVGENIENVCIKDFKLPKGSPLTSKLPGFAVKWITSLIRVRPEINKKKCTQCQVCIKSCPVNAVRAVANYLVVDDAACIECLCCHEFCPNKAILLKRSFLHRKIVRD
ncbi:MAG: DUF362 domain-containing protein [bacterium]